jgi:hypothetical protein
MVGMQIRCRRNRLCGRDDRDGRPIGIVGHVDRTAAVARNDASPAGELGEDGETWRRLRIEFPGYIAAHSPVQTLYIGPDNLLRRHDYSVDIVGGTATAHYTADYRTFDGFGFPTRRRVVRRQPDNTTSGPVLIALDIHSLSLS